MIMYAKWDKSRLREELDAWQHDLEMVQNFLKEYPDDVNARKEQAEIVVEIATIKAYLGHKRF
jgi:predicted translin family RNA/ssDNA-binding protein